MFPGQSSRYPELLERLARSDKNRMVFEEASDILREDVSAIFRSSDRALFASNRNIQVAVFLANHIHYTSLAALGINANYSFGLSLGEYNHLVEIEALDFADALRLVDVRGRAYDDGPRGMMVSLFPTSRQVVSDILNEVRLIGEVAISNENSPRQFVIAGVRPAVERAAALFAEREFVEPVVIEGEIPMHCKVFEPVAQKLMPHLAAAPWRKPSKSYLPNTTAEWINNPLPEEFVRSLTEHVFRPVLWRHSVEAVLARAPNAIFVEVGPRRILCNLLSRRWVANQRYASDEIGAEAIVEVLAGEMVDAK